jgi:hypothetical protein
MVPGVGGRTGPEASGGRSPDRGATFSSSAGGGATGSTFFSSFAPNWAGESRRSGVWSERLSRGSALSGSVSLVARGAPSSPWKMWRSCSATSSSTELEWVFPLIPNSLSLSRMALDFTSRSRASSLIRRDLFIVRLSVRLSPANYTVSSGWGTDSDGACSAATVSRPSILSDSISVLSEPSAIATSASAGATSDSDAV